MARGRMLNRKISQDTRVATLHRELGPDAVILFTWMIPHLDRDGRISGEPEVLAGTVAPLIPSIDAELAEKTLALASEIGLLIWYEDETEARFVSYPSFAANQVGLRYKREPASDFPLPEDCRKIAGNLPEDFRKPSGLIEGKGIERNRREGNKNKEAGDKETTPITPDIDAVWQHYRTHHPRAPAVLKASREEAKKIRLRLADFSVEDLCRAIDGYHHSPFHQGENATGTKYDKLELMMRTVGHVTKGIEMAQRQNEPRLSAQTRRTVSAAQSWLQRKANQ